MMQEKLGREMMSIDVWCMLPLHFPPKDAKGNPGILAYHTSHISWTDCNSVIWPSSCSVAAVGSHICTSGHRGDDDDDDDDDDEDEQD